MIPGTWKTKANVFNDYEVDRLGQKTFLYSGIKTFPLQDIAMMENQWGPIAKRELEHLVRHGLPHDLPAPEAAAGRARTCATASSPGSRGMPETYHYHSASAIIENGDFEAAVAKAKEKAKQSLVDPVLEATTIAASGNGHGAVAAS